MLNCTAGTLTITFGRFEAADWNWLASTLLHQVSQDVVLVKIAVGLKFEFLTFKLDHNKMSFTTELYDNYIQTVE